MEGQTKRKPQSGYQTRDIRPEVRDDRKEGARRVCCY